MKPIWEMSTRVRDLILWSSYDAEEIEKRAQTAHADLEYCSFVDSHAASLIAAYQACSSECDFSRVIQCELDDRYADGLLWLLGATPSELFEVARGPLDCLPCPLPALLWAVARSDYSNLDQALQILEWRFTVEAARVYAFGKVEVFDRCEGGR